MKLFNKVVIIGVGLIGGSLGLAIKKKRLANKVIGVFRSKDTFLKAKKRKAVDEGSFDLSCVKDADLVVLAGPVKTITAHIKLIANLVNRNCIIIDVGSTKSNILKSAQKYIKNDNIFVGCHPLAGLEKRGVVNADSGLFEDSICIVCSKNKPNSKIISFWKHIGCRVITMDAKRHDRILALTSHVPHVLAFALVNSVPKDFVQFIGSGFKDTTRIAASDVEVWNDILLDNKNLVLDSLRNFGNQLDRLAKAIKKNNTSSLAKLIKKAKTKRVSFK